MAVPKKRQSKSKTNSRKHIWKRKLVKQAAKAFSLAKAVLGTRSKFVHTKGNQVPKPKSTGGIGFGKKSLINKQPKDS